MWCMESSRHSNLSGWRTCGHSRGADRGLSRPCGDSLQVVVRRSGRCRPPRCCGCLWGWSYVASISKRVPLSWTWRAGATLICPDIYRLACSSRSCSTWIAWGPCGRCSVWSLVRDRRWWVLVGVVLAVQAAALWSRWRVQRGVARVDHAEAAVVADCNKTSAPATY